MDSPTLNYKNLISNFPKMTFKVLLLKILDFVIPIVLQLFFELMISQYRIQMPSILLLHAVIQTTIHQIKSHRIFKDKEKQLQAIQKIPLLIYTQISILQVLKPKN